jgi:hypothetical protein
MGVDWSSAWAAGQHSSTAAPAPAATEAPAPSVASAAPAPATTSSASSSAADGVKSTVDSIVDDVKDLWDGLVGASNSRSSFGTYYKVPGGPAETGPLSQGDAFHGNVGSPYGSNIIKVASTSGYDFTNTFVNTQSETITINIWNKGGSDGQTQSGAFLAPKDTSLTFALPAGASQVVAFMEDSQVAWAQACSSIAFAGNYQTTWGEAQFVGTGSGYDVTAIMGNNNNYDMTITSVEAPACTSDRTQNMWLAAYTPIGDSNGSCYIAQSTAHLTTKMSGTV